MSNAIEQPNEYSVDLRPLPEPGNPFQVVANAIRERYPTLSGEDRQTVDWLMRLATESPDLSSNSRLLALALAGAATDYDQRELLKSGLAVIENALSS